MTWWTLESTRVPERLGYLSDTVTGTRVEEMLAPKREELIMIRLMKAARIGIKLMSKQKYVIMWEELMKMQEICGLEDVPLKLMAMEKKLIHGWIQTWSGLDHYCTHVRSS